MVGILSREKPGALSRGAAKRYSSSPIGRYVPDEVSDEVAALIPYPMWK